MKTPKILVLSALTLVATLPVARAGFGDLLKQDSAPAVAAPSVGDFSNLLDSTTGNVLAARIQFLDAQADLSSALGLSTDSIVKASEGLRAMEGTSSSSSEKLKAIKDSNKKTENAKKEFSEALAKSQTLSEESKAKFAKGTVKFLQGVILEKQQIVTITSLVAQGKALVSSAGIMGKVKAMGMVKPASEMAFLVPGDVKEGFTTLGQITSFANKQNITVPSQDEINKDLGDQA